MDLPEVWNVLEAADRGGRKIVDGSTDNDALEVVSAINVLADLLEARSYSYEEIDVKRFVPDADACEICEDAADLGWIPDEDTFEGVFGDEDGPPLHPHCGCGLEYGTKRQRVYD